MDSQTAELIERIREQYNAYPYPPISLEQSPRDDLDSLQIHNLVTAHYRRNQRVISTEGKVILDAGCGSGYKSLILAEANPGTHIIGIDISEASVAMARERLKYHGFDNVEFRVMSIDDIASLGMEFDYINCDEVLYLLPDPAAALTRMKSVLKPDGIIRTNLHSALQRANFYRAQSMFKLMGLLDSSPQDMEVDLVIETMKSLHDTVELKQRVWKQEYENEEAKGTILVNHLLIGDKGFTIPELFQALRKADLEFISMVRWRNWQLLDLFKEPDNLPAFFGLSLPEIGIEQELQLFELLHPVHRLLDFWCGHPGATTPRRPTAEWDFTDWQRAIVHLHPQQRVAVVQNLVLQSAFERKAFMLQYQNVISSLSIPIEGAMAACLLPLWDNPQPVTALVERWLWVRPISPVTLEPIPPLTAFQQIIELLTQLENCFYVLLELPEH